MNGVDMRIVLWIPGIILWLAAGYLGARLWNALIFLSDNTYYVVKWGWNRPVTSNEGQASFAFRVVCGGATLALFIMVVGIAFLAWALIQFPRGNRRISGPALKKQPF